MLLPEPFGPRKPKISPSRTAISSDSSARTGGVVDRLHAGSGRLRAGDVQQVMANSTPAANALLAAPAPRWRRRLP